MKEAQAAVAFDRYLRPAIDISVSLGFVLPLSLAVVYDSVTHGSWERIAAKVSRDLDEKDWVAEYVRKRHFWLTHITRLKATSYRTTFFLDQIATANWQLDRPMNVHGVRLLPAMFAGADGLAAATATNASDSSSIPHTSAENDPPETHLQPPILKTAEDAFDRVDEIVAGVATRTDRAKSLWTTVIGTLWQTAWAVFGFVVGLPREVWIVVAVIAALLMLAYLYRQIVMGKIREVKSEKWERDEIHRY